MKKLKLKDKKLRFNIRMFNKLYHIVKSITKNKYLFVYMRKNANKKLKKLCSIFKLTSTVNRCVYSISKKRYNKFSLFSRFIYLKLIRNGLVGGFKKCSW